MSILNRIHNSTNPYQGESPKVVCVCSAGLLRSPTLARVLLKDPYQCNTRAVGASDEFALIPLDEVLVSWADCIIFVSQEVFDTASAKNILTDKECVILDIPDKFSYMDQQLVKEIKKHLTDIDFLGIIRSYNEKIPEHRQHRRIATSTQKVDN